MARPRLPRRSLPQPAHPLGDAVARPKGRAFIRARQWRPAPPSPAARFAHSPHPPLAPSGPGRKSVSQSGGRGRSIGSRCAALADGATSASAPPSPRALMGRSAPMPPEAACGRVGAPLARIAPPNPAAPAIALARRHAPRAARCQRRPLGLCIAPRSIVQAPPAGGSAARAAGPSSSLRRCGFRGQPARRGWLPLSWLLGQPLRPSPAASSARKHQLGLPRLLFAGPAGFPFLLHFFSFRLANICSIWYNCIGRFCL